MTSSRKKPGLAFWATVVVVVGLALVGYPASVGPICWLEVRGYIPSEVYGVIYDLYAPLRWLCQVAPHQFSDSLDWWAEWCAG